MKILDKKITQDIHKLFGLLDSESLEISNKYFTKSFSVFDHWLNEDEFINTITSFSQVCNKPNKIHHKQFLTRENKLLNFYIDLYKESTVYGILSSEYSGSKVKIIFDNIKEYKSHVLLSIREQLFLEIVIPEYFSVITGGYDLTHLFYTLKSKPEGFKNLSSIIQSNDLFILN